MAYSSVSCMDCGAIELDTHTEPCPQCGSTRLNTTLSPDPIVVTVHVLSPELIITEYHEVLLSFASNLIDQGQYSFAIVLAHTACELAVEQVFNKLFEDRKLTDFREFIMPGRLSYNISANDIKERYNKLANDNIQSDKNAFWKPFTDSVKRRKGIVHHGKMFGREDAEKSLKAIKCLIKYLKQKHNMPWN